MLGFDITSLTVLFLNDDWYNLTLKIYFIKAKLVACSSCFYYFKTKTKKMYLKIKLNFFYVLLYETVINLQIG